MSGTTSGAADAWMFLERPPAPQKDVELPGTTHLPKTYNSEKYKKWDGLGCREDPQRAFLADMKRERMANAVSAKEKQIANLESLRETRAMLNKMLGHNPPPYDEFTVFGLPSDHKIEQVFTTRDCLSHGSGQSPLDNKPGPVRGRTPRETPQSARIKEMRKEIRQLEDALYTPHRPISARSKPLPPPLPPPSPRMSSAGPRRPATSIRAYQKAGLDGNAYTWLGPGAVQAMESFRAAPKFEEQMLLGFLKQAHGTGRLTPRPLWKMSRFEREGPRNPLPLPELDG